MSLSLKTAASSGATAIVFTPELYHECRIFVQKIRNGLAGALISGESFVFLAGRGIRCHRRCWEISFLAERQIRKLTNYFGTNICRI